MTGTKKAGQGESGRIRFPVLFFRAPSSVAVRFPMELMVMTRLAQLRIAARVEDVRSDGETESRADKHVGRPVIACKEPASSYRHCRSISQHLHPRLRV